MSDSLIGVLGIAALFALLALRVPVAFAMFAVGFLGVWVLNGLNASMSLLASEAFTLASSPELIVIPLFILMGNVASQTGMSRKLFDAAYAVIGSIKGGLASATVIGCGGFAALSGSSVASALTMGKVALAEMDRFNYDDRLSTGVVAAGGTLGILIPPSTGFVIYAILTEQSIGRLFMAGILPGALLMILFIATVWLMALRNPTEAPAGPNVPMGERFRILGHAAPLLGVMVLTIGGIYVGAFTPVEASGIGAGLVILIALLTRKLNWQGFYEALLDTLKTTAMLYMIVIGANVLNPFFAVTQIPATLGEGLQSLGLGPYGTLLVIILAYVAMGMFMDGLSMLVISIPVVFPVIVAMGFDPIWFGVVAVIVIEMGMITPPVGLNVFVVRGVAGDVPLTTVFRGVAPFLLAMIVGLILIILIPQIALLIPNSMFG